MQLNIIDKKNLLSDMFLVWIIRRLKEQMIAYIDENKLKSWDSYLNEQTSFKSIYLKKISAKDILLSGINNLIFNKSSSKISILIDPNQYLPGMDRIKIYDMCKMINYGTLSQKGYPLFTNIFKQVESTFGEYVDEYLKIG